MNRRESAQLVLALAAAWPLGAFAQGRPGKVARIGLLFVSAGAANMARPVPAALRELGWIEGRNVVYDWRVADGRPDELPRLAAELVALDPDVILVPTDFEAAAALGATRSIPIIVAGAGDPVATGLARSLSHPGGSVTGLRWADLALASKLVQILREAVPTMHRLADLYDPRYPGVVSFIEAQQAAADMIGLTLRRFPVRSADDIAAALSTMDKERVDAIFIIPNGVLAADVDRVLRYASERHLPTAFPIPWPVERGGFLAYCPSVAEVVSRVAAFADKILKGAKPADLPFEYPTRFELTINLKTAKALGISLPQAVLLRADRLIE